jgi:capsular exopolysaccharide synthesis family protein
MRIRFGGKRSAAGGDAGAADASESSAGRGTQRVASGWLVEREFVSTPELAMIHEPRSIGAEKFRRLKTSLVYQTSRPIQVVVVTSGAPSEGKSMVAMNLALAFAADGERTLLIDADLRRPSIGRFISPPPGIGLAEVLSGEAEIEHAVLSVKKSSLKILPAGHPSPDPLSLLAADGARVLMRRLREQFDRIVIDTPPTVPFTDADAAGALGDGIVLVVRSNVTPTWVVEKALESVTSTEIVGVVFNDSDGALAGRSRYYDKYYRQYYVQDPNAAGSTGGGDGKKP